MEADLEISLNIAKEILKLKRAELKMLVITLQDTKALSDELICLLAEFWNVANKEVEALQQVIDSLKEQKRIFGKTGLKKELEIVPKEEYPDEQQPENI